MNILNIHQKLEKVRGLLSFVPSKIVQISVVLGTAFLITIAGYDIPAMVAVSKDTSNYVTFTEWCLNTANLDPDARHTVSELLKTSGFSDCKQANQNLSAKRLLLLSDSKIVGSDAQ